MISIIFFILLGLFGVALIFFDFMKLFSLQALEQPSGRSQSKMTTTGLIMIVVSVVFIIYKFITV